MNCFEFSNSTFKGNKNLNFMAFGAAIKKKSLGPPSYIGKKDSLPIEYSPSLIPESRG